MYCGRCANLECYDKPLGYGTVNMNLSQCQSIQQMVILSSRPYRNAGNQKISKLAIYFEFFLYHLFCNVNYLKYCTRCYTCMLPHWYLWLTKGHLWKCKELFLCLCTFLCNSECTQSNYHLWGCQVVVLFRHIGLFLLSCICTLKWMKSFRAHSHHVLGCTGQPCLTQRPGILPWFLCAHFEAPLCGGVC